MNTAYMSRVRSIILSVIAATVIVILSVLLLEKSRTSSHQSQPGSSGSRMSEPVGVNIYRQRCLYCHLENGRGIPGQFPPLAGSSWTTGDPERLIKIMLHGMAGPVRLQDAEYNGVMPGWHEQLSFAEIAAVLGYVRSAWGNRASAVDSGMVKNVWEKFRERREPWRAEELAVQ